MPGYCPVDGTTSDCSARDHNATARPVWTRGAGLRPAFLVLVAMVGLFVTHATGAAGARVAASRRPRPLPPFAVVRTTVEQVLGEIEDRKPGDLILRAQVAPIFARLAKLGWTVADRQAILQRVPAEKDLLARQLLDSKQGIKFMRQISRYPLGYDRVDRINHLPLGKQTVHDLIHKVGGAEMIRYMTEAKGGKALGGMLSRDPNGKDFNKPTGRIYTAEQLIKTLKESQRELPGRETPPGEAAVASSPLA